MRLIYIANARIPTEKAHGVQIIKTCEALVKEGVDLELWLPKRIQPESFKETNLFNYYGCKETFRVKKISTIDFLPVTAKIGGILDLLAYYLQELSFILGIFFQDYKNRPVYTRSLMAAITIKLFRRVPVYCEVHTIPTKKITGSIFRLILKKLNGVVVVTEGLKQELDLKAPITVIPNAVDLGQYLGVNREDARKTLSLPARDKIVVYTGSVNLNRGIYTLIEAVKLLRTTDINFLLVGRTEEFNLDSTLMNVKVVGYVPHSKIHLYQMAADILVLPSGKETYSFEHHGT